MTRLKAVPRVVYDLEWFMKRVEIVTETGCWLWLGNMSKTGYGIVGHSRREQVLAHRKVLELFGVEVPKEKPVCHKCDVRCCVNPQHVYVGTTSENQWDRVLRGPHNTRKLTIPEVLEIRASTEPTKRLVEKFGITKGQVRNIQLRKQWKHV